MWLRSFVLLSIAFVTFYASAADIVKKSNSGICHTTDSPWYERTKNFTPYDTLAECLKAGGRKPKGQQSNRQLHKFIEL